MFESISLDNFESEILKEKGPILLAYICRDHEFKRQIDILKTISKKYGETLKICLLDEKYGKTYKEFEIEGDPTFLVYYRGKKSGMMLGKVDTETLCSFISKTLPNF